MAKPVVIMHNAREVCICGHKRLCGDVESHPRLGKDKYVLTSKVVRRISPTRIATLNTIYVLA